MIAAIQAFFASAVDALFWTFVATGAAAGAAAGAALELVGRAADRVFGPRR